MIDYNDMSMRLGLFYAERLGNRIHCTFISTFCLYVVIFEEFYLFGWGLFFAQGQSEYELFLNKSVWSINEKLIGTTTLGQSGPGSNEHEMVLHTLPNSSFTIR